MIDRILFMFSYKNPDNVIILSFMIMNILFYVSHLYYIYHFYSRFNIINLIGIIIEVLFFILILLSNTKSLKDNKEIGILKAKYEYRKTIINIIDLILIFIIILFNSILFMLSLLWYCFIYFDYDIFKQMNITLNY